MLNSNESGFTLIEIIIAILLLTTAVLGIAASSGQMIGPAGEAEIEFQALQAVEDRITLISLDPRYVVLDSLYEGSEEGLPGLTGLVRTTTITRRQTQMQTGKVLDFTDVIVVVAGPGLANPVSRKLVVGAP